MKIPMDDVPEHAAMLLGGGLDNPGTEKKYLHPSAVRGTN